MRYRLAFKSLFKITFCTGRPWPFKRTYQFHVNRIQISTHSYKMVFCVSGTELTNQLKGNRNRGKPFVGEVMSRCRHVMIITKAGGLGILFSLAIVSVGSVKKHAFFSNNPCYRSLTPNINNKEKFKLAWKWNLAKQFSSFFRIFKSLFENIDWFLCFQAIWHRIP